MDQEMEVHDPASSVKRPWKTPRVLLSVVDEAENTPVGAGADGGHSSVS